jgi:hypothetical protein
MRFRSLVPFVFGAFGAKAFSPTAPTTTEGNFVVALMAFFCGVPFSFAAFFAKAFSPTMAGNFVVALRAFFLNVPFSFGAFGAKAFSPTLGIKAKRFALMAFACFFVARRPTEQACPCSARRCLSHPCLLTE